MSGPELDNSNTYNTTLCEVAYLVYMTFMTRTRAWQQQHLKHNSVWGHMSGVHDVPVIISSSGCHCCDNTHHHHHHWHHQHGTLCNYRLVSLQTTSYHGRSSQEVMPRWLLFNTFSFFLLMLEQETFLGFFQTFWKMKGSLVLPPSLLK